MDSRNTGAKWVQGRARRQEHIGSEGEQRHRSKVCVSLKERRDIGFERV